MVFPDDEVSQARVEVQTRAERLAASITRLESRLSLISAPIPEGWFSTEDLHFLRFTLVECFVSPICVEGDRRAICVELEAVRAAPEETPMGLGERALVQGYVPCPVKDVEGMRGAEERWSDVAREWFVERLYAVDALRVQLKASIPDRTTELDRVLDGIDVGIRQQYIEAEDRWREVQRQEARTETRRRDEERWERFQVEMSAYDEELTRARDAMEMLRALSRREVLRIATRLATLGEPLF